jgi:hypothetical protein
MTGGNEPNIPTETVENYQDADNGQIVPNSGPTGQSEAIAETADNVAYDNATAIGEHMAQNVDLGRGE